MDWYFVKYNKKELLEKWNDRDFECPIFRSGRHKSLCQTARKEDLFPLLVLIWHSSDKYVGSMGSQRVRHDLATEQQ